MCVKLDNRNVSTTVFELSLLTRIIWLKTKMAANQSQLTHTIAWTDTAESTGVCLSQVGDKT